MKELIQRITALLYDKKKRKIRNKVGYAVACVVVFITTYALILPAITMEKHVACGIPEHQHSEECYEERLVCGLDEYIPVSDEAGGIDVIAEDDSSGLDVIEDSEPVQGHVHTEACYEKVLVCGMEPHTHSAACYKKQDSSVAENTVDEGPAPQENGSVEGDYIEENESGDELVYEEGAAEDLTDEYLSSGQEDIPASENNGAQDVSEGEDLSSGQEDISAAGNNGAQDVSEGEDLSSGQEDISAAENDGVQDVSDGAAAASGDVRDGSVSGQEETGESLTGPVDAPAENGVQEDGDSQASGDEASGQPVEDTDQSAVDAAPADSGEPSEDQSSEPENSIVYLDDESSDGGQAAGTDASKDGAASENTEGENEVPEQGAEDGSTIQESGAEGQQAQAEDPSQGSVSLADYLTGATAVYYSRTAGNDGEDEWKPVENDTVLMPSDKIRVYLAYQLPGGLLNGTDSRARYMLPEQLWLSGSRVDRINHFENGIASGTEDETEKASLLGAEAVEGTRRPDEQRSGQTEFISAIVNIENVQDAEGRLSGQELVFRFVPYTVEKNSDVFDAEGTLTSKGQEVNGYFTIDYMVNEILSGIAADGGASSDQAAEQVREAVIVFASVNTESGQREISAKLKISETAAEADPEEQDSKTAEEDPESAEGENAQADPESEEGENAQTDPESEEGEEAQTDSESEEGEGVQTDPESAEGETAQKDPESADEETEDKDADEENEGGEITADASDGSDSAAEAAGGLSDQLPDMPAQNFEQTIRVKTGGTGSGNAVSDFFKNLFGFFTGNGGADSDDAGEALSSEADLTVHVDADEGTFPAGTTMTVKPVSGRELNAVSDAISETVDSETCGFQAVDITFRDAHGKEIEPKKPVRVTFSTDLISEAAQNDKIGQPVIVHVQDDGSAQALSSSAAAEGAAEAAEDGKAAGTSNNAGAEQSSVTFETGETVESEQTDNNDGDGVNSDPEQTGNDSGEGKAVESGQAGDHTGSDVSDDSGLNGDVVEDSEPEEKKETQTGESEDPDGITVDTDSFSIYVIVYTVDFHWEVNGKHYDFSIPGGGYVSFADLVEVLGIAKQETEDDGSAGEDKTDTETAALTLGDINVSEETRKFVADVESITFSTPSLVSVSKVEENTTVGAIKGSLGLECVYSAELTKEQIEEINATAVESGDWALISLQPFISTESLAVTMKSGDTFEIRVTDGQIKKTVITSSGDTYEITVTYGEDAQIPDGAELKVREILPDEDNYAEYYEKAAEFAGNEAHEKGIEWPVINEERLFDIEIHGKEGKIEPADSVQVDIRLVGKTAESLSVIHFAGEGPETMALQNLEMSADEPLHSDEKSSGGETVSDNDDKNNGNTGDSAENVVSRLSFSTDSFSVYSVVKVNSGTDLVSGGPWAFVTDIANDPGATTGYSESWGQDYFTIIVNANAMLDKPVISNNSEIAYQAEGVHVWTNGTESYVGGDAPQVWNFERVPNSDKYYIYVQRNGTKYYIDHHYGSRETTSLSTQWRTEFTITRNNDGTIRINNGDWYLCNSGNGEWSSRDYRFSNNSNIRNQKWSKFRLCKISDAFESFAAHKVSASTITTNTNYVIYRKFEDAKGNEALYALAHDGTFVRVYDGGDTVYWRETQKNIYWNYQLDGKYPVLFTLNPETDNEIFIHPNHSTGQMLSDTAEGLTLLGKDNGEYATSIECWDQAAYDYAGLHVTLNGDGSASLSTGTRVAETSDEFLFAVASQMPGATAETVETVDSNSMGIKITMFDYGDPTKEYNAGDKLEEMTNVAGSADYTPHAAHALVKPYLENGIPSSTSKGAMTGLFTAGGSAVTASRENINHLFIKSYYDENGTFRYRSEDNYAYLPYNPQTKSITGNDFTVYRQAATPYTSNISVGHTYYHHGHFMPFNEIDMNNNLSRLMNQYGNAYENGTIVGEIPLGDGRTYEDVYGTKGIPNFYTGMKMESAFTQPRGGKLENGDDMIFKFTGDDDMWVYIDGVLVLDIGGIHEPLSGTINFATGEVINPTGSSLAGTTTLRAIFDNVLNDGATPNAVKDKIRSITWNGDTFADYTNHDFKAFYMERGAGASNLDIQFNLKVTLTNEFTVEKAIPEGVDGRFANQTYKFMATYLDGNTEKPLYAGIRNVCSAVVYRDKKDDQGNPVPVAVDDNGCFILKAGEAAVFKMLDESIKYNVKEIDIDSGLITQVDINGVQTTVTNGTASAGDYTMVADRTQVLVTNHPKTQNLLITKHLTEDSAPLEAGEHPVFEFRVYLETTVNNADGTTQKKLVPYSYGPYYLTKIINDATHYFTLTGVNNAPVDKGTEPVICSTTGRSGSINSIPPEYTIVIPNLVVGTNFYLEERRDNIPYGYEFVKEELKAGTYDPSTLIETGAGSGVINRVLARDENDKQVFDPETVGQIKNGSDAESHVYNRKPFKTGGLTIKKLVTVNNAEVPSESKTIADGTYTFTITGPDNYTYTRTITVTNGLAESDIVIEDLAEGSYTITETDSTNINGIALDGPKTVTITAGMQASENVTRFTNNLSVASLEIIKVKKGSKDHVLGGAKFELTKVDENNNIITGEARWSDIKTSDSTTGKTSFTGVVPGRYMLEEKEAPFGYVLIETPWFITVNPHGTASLEVEYQMASAAGEEKPNTFYIENEPGTELPHTGGSGTKSFYILGLMLMAAGYVGVLLKRRRRD